MQLRWDEIDAVIWDFNGTLIDDVDVIVSSVNVQLAQRNLPLLTKERLREVFGFPVIDYYRRIGLDPDAESMADLSAAFFAVYEPQLQTCSLHDGVLEALDAFDGHGVRQFVLSAMEEELLHATLERLGILSRFVGVYGLAHLEGDSKLSRGQQLRADYDLRPSASLLIGDTDHDAEVADALGMNVLLVSTGHQSEARLRATGSPVIGCLSELAMDT